MREYVEYIAKSLVDHPDQVTVTETASEQGTVIRLSVPKEDRGKVIGRQGRTARALRTLVSAASARQGSHTLLEIEE